MITLRKQHIMVAMLRKKIKVNFTILLCIKMKSNQRYDNFVERATFLRKTINDLKVKKKYTIKTHTRYLILHKA